MPTANTDFENRLLFASATIAAIKQGAQPYAEYSKCNCPGVQAHRTLALTRSLRVASTVLANLYVEFTIANPAERTEQDERLMVACIQSARKHLGHTPTLAMVHRLYRRAMVARFRKGQ